MGSGDWLICTGQVKSVYSVSRLPVMVVNRYGKPQWDPVFEHNPKITMDIRVIHQRIVNASGSRPYIAEQSKARWRWKRFGIVPGELFFSVDEVAFAAPYAGKVLIEPNIKGTSGGNKAWIWERWQQLVDRGEHEYIQVGAAGSPKLNGVTYVHTPTFRHACAVLAQSRAFVGTEGGLHHAAAAVGVPATVLFGGFISPDITGYKSHRNLFTGGVACGLRTPCQHCRDAMGKITVDMVAGNLKEIVDEADARLVLAGPRTTPYPVDVEPKGTDAATWPASLPGA